MNNKYVCNIKIYKVYIKYIYNIIINYIYLFRRRCKSRRNHQCYSLYDCQRQYAFSDSR